MKPSSYNDKYNTSLEPSALFTNRLNDLKEELKVQLPCKVLEINHESNRVSVQILDYTADEEGILIDYPVIPNVPIRQPLDSASAYIRLPIQVGDIGTIEFFDSSVDNLVITDKYDYDYSEDWHSLNNGLFTNGFLPQGKLFEFDSDSKIVIGTKDNVFTFKVNASNELEVEASSISIKANRKMDIECPDININSSIGVTVDSPDLNVSGDVTVGAGASGVVACQSKTITITNGIVTNID